MLSLSCLLCDPSQQRWQTALQHVWQNISSVDLSWDFTWQVTWFLKYEFKCSWLNSISMVVWWSPRMVFRVLWALTQSPQIIPLHWRQNETKAIRFEHPTHFGGSFWLCLFGLVVSAWCSLRRGSNPYKGGSFDKSSSFVCIDIAQVGQAKWLRCRLHSSLHSTIHFKQKVCRHRRVFGRVKMSLQKEHVSSLVSSPMKFLTWISPISRQKWQPLKAISRHDLTKTIYIYI